DRRAGGGAQLAGVAGAVVEIRVPEEERRSRLRRRGQDQQPRPVHLEQELDDSMTESPDQLTYTFKLRQGVKFHNGKPMTSADVVASFDRYSKIALERSTFDDVAKWEAPDKDTFVITMKRAVPTFIEQLSSFSVPIVIIPAENEDDPPQRLKPVGTGPFEFVEYVADSHVKL